MNKVKVEFEVLLSDQDIDDIMASALEGGITYWCGQVDVVDKYLGEYASDQISRGGSLILYDCESDDKWVLTKEKFLNGVKKFISIHLSVLDKNKEIDACEIDGDYADRIIQYALFDDIVFG